jgi:type III pantothenate kinase
VIVESGYPLVAVDVGNSRVKFGLFDGAGAAACGARVPAAEVRGVGVPPAAALPAPSRSLDWTPGEDEFEALSLWLAPYTPRDVAWWIGSVERQVSSRLVAWLRSAGAERTTLLASIDLPLVVSLPRSDMVGIDRLLAGVAANRLRTPDAPAIVVDLGTAITVDLISSAGAFLGGAILPGIGLSARALHEFTDLLPWLDMPDLADPPPALGKGTVEALRSGIYWGAVGGVKQLIELLSAQVAGEPSIYLTGGAAPSIAGLLSDSAQYVPHLTLAGIVITAKETKTGG